MANRWNKLVSKTIAIIVLMSFVSCRTGRFASYAADIGDSMLIYIPNLPCKTKTTDVYAKQFRDNKTVKYRIVPTSETEGNCNSSTTSLLFNAGVNEQEIQRIDSEVSGIDIGFGVVKPWTKEQRKEAEARQKERAKMNESLSNQIGF